MVRTVSHGVYIIYLFEVGRHIMPRSEGIAANLRRLMSYYAPNTQMILFVRPDPALRVFADIVMRTFHLMSRQYVFTTKLEQALALIEAHRRSQTNA